MVFFSYMVTLLVHLHCRKVTVEIFIQRIIPTPHCMVHLSAKSSFKPVKAMHWMRGVVVGSNSKHIIVDTPSLPCNGYCPPLQRVGCHKIPLARRRGSVQVGCPRVGYNQKHCRQWESIMSGYQKYHLCR